MTKITLHTSYLINSIYFSVFCTFIIEDFKVNVLYYRYMYRHEHFMLPVQVPS